jgi:DNA-binding transcriptional MerR regulator
VAGIVADAVAGHLLATVFFGAPWPWPAWWPAWPRGGRMTDEHRERTLAEAARELALPERTLRRYLDRFKPWIQARTRGRTRLLDADALDVLRLVREHLVAGRSASEVERLLVERRGRVIDASGAEPAQATLARADFEHQALEVRRLREGVGLLLEHLESERADRARLLDLVEHQAEELAALRQVVAQMAEDLLQGRQEEPPETPQGPFHALRRILGFIGVREDR